MAKKNQSQREEVVVREPEITPEWVQANAEKLAAAGFKVVTTEQFTQEAQAAQAARDLVGIDLEARESIKEGDARLRELPDLILRMRKQLDLILESSQFKSKTTQKERIAIRAARVLIRQLLNEPAPPGQAATLRELIGDHAGIPDGVLNDRGRPQRSPKTFRVTPEHYKQAGVL